MFIRMMVVVAVKVSKNILQLALRSRRCAMLLSTLNTLFPSGNPRTRTAGSGFVLLGIRACAAVRVLRPRVSEARPGSALTWAPDLL